MIQLNEIATSTCRNCRFYQPNGHQGGNCQQFQVTVDGNWSTCKLALPAFARDWQTIEDLPVQITEPVAEPVLESRLVTTEKSRVR
jgi:hypothetical protein